MSGFKGVVMGVEYTDRQEFEKAARDAGWRSGASAERGGRSGDWRVGMQCAFMVDMELYRGQVWSKGAEAGTVILALDGGRYARVRTATGSGSLIDARGIAGARGRIPTVRELARYAAAPPATEGA